MRYEIKILIFILFVLVLLIFSKKAFSQGWVQLNSGVTTGLVHLNFLNANTGFAVSPLIRTTDGGNSWTLIPMGGYNFSRVYFFDLNTGYGMGGGSVYKTTNGGANWTTSISDYVEQMYFVNVNTGYFVNSFEFGISDFLGTTNAGQNWNVLSSYLLYSYYHDLIHYYSIHFVNPSVGCLVGVTYYQTYMNGAYVLKTTDAGLDWQNLLVSSGNDVYSDCCFSSPNFGYITSYAWSGADSGKIYNQSSNLLLAYNHKLYGVNSPSQSVVCAVGVAGSIVKTTDSGVTWQIQSSPVSTVLNKVQFIDNNTGYIVGNNGTILKTTTGGVIYNTISGQIRFQDNNQIVTSGFVKAVKYDRIQNQIITIDSASIQSNGTYSLTRIPQDSIYIMAFENDEAQLVFVPTYYPSTTNWRSATVLYPSGNLSGIDILVYRIISTGGPYHISGLVSNYTQAPLSGLKDAIVYAKIGNDYKGYSITNSSGLYRIDSLTSGSYNLMVDRIGYSSQNRQVIITSFSKDTINFIFNLTKVTNNGSEIPGSYFLCNNYPNPFNPKTIIKYQIPSANNVRLFIYDVLGREITTLIDERQEAGTYEIEFDGSNFASGVYFYRMEVQKTGSPGYDFIQSKKMVLMK